ncbi:MAG: hypothetical protein LBC59_03535 [Chitinispirillales bacterium]|jgi:hypothetical protein|nr:hypothetical protein [Chitinispirillales bacterium]
MRKILDLSALVVVAAFLSVGCLSDGQYTVALPDHVAVEPDDPTAVEPPDEPPPIERPPVVMIPPIVVITPDDPPTVEPPDGPPPIERPPLVIGGCEGMSFQHGEIPTGTDGILSGVELNSGTIISGGAAIITVSSSGELNRLYMQIEGEPGYYLLCLDQAAPVNGVYTYTSTVAISQDLGNESLRMTFSGRSGSQISTPIVSTVATRSVGSGELQVSLSWNNRDDLDLHIETPRGGHIYYANRSVGNGRLDLDANVGCGDVSNENIFFNGTLEDGIYRVWVNLYTKCGTPGAQYSVTASSGGRAFIFSRDGLSESGRFADSDRAGNNKVIGYITVQNGRIVATDYAALGRQGLLKQPVNSQRKSKN